MENQVAEKDTQAVLSQTEQKFREKQAKKQAKREARIQAIEERKQSINAEIAEEQKRVKRCLLKTKYLFVLIWGKIVQNIGGFCKKYFIDAFSGMAMGLFATLIIGTIICTIGDICGKTTTVGIVLNNIGTVGKILTGAGIGIGIAHALKVPKLVMFSATVAGFIGGNAVTLLNGSFIGAPVSTALVGDPVTAYVAVVISIELSKLLVGRTKVDILVVPLVTIGVAMGVAFAVGPAFKWLFAQIGEGISRATELQPIPMGMVVALLMGILLTLPTSSAAIGVAIWSSFGEQGTIAMAAAAVGCACHMIGFAVASFRENKWGGLVAQGLGTSMLQIPNLMRNFRIIIPAVVASLICGPIATAGFGLLCDFSGSGMGTAGLVGVIMMMKTSGVASATAWIGMLLTMFILPAIIAFVTSEILRKIGWIRKDDMKLEL